MQHINSLLSNDWIGERGGAWGSLIVLAPKPQKEHVNDINDFIWHMCVSYRKLNGVTLAFEYPIPRCDDAIDDLVTASVDCGLSVSTHAKATIKSVSASWTKRNSPSLAPTGKIYF
jgi:hypothetical protein